MPTQNDAAYEPLPQPHQLPQIEGLQIPPGVWADYQDVTQRGRPGGDEGASRPGTAGAAIRVPKAADDPRRAYLPNPNYPPHPQPIGQPMHMAPFGLGHNGAYYNAPPPPPGQPHHMPYSTYYPLPPPPGMAPLPGQPGSTLPPHGMAPYYHHPDMMYRYGNVTPPVSAEPSSTSNGHLPLPLGGMGPPAAAGMPPGGPDRRSSIAPSKRTSVSRHLQSHSPYPSGSPSARSSIGNGEHLAADPAAAYPAAMACASYGASPNGSGSGGEIGHQHARAPVQPGYDEGIAWQSHHYASGPNRHDDPRYAHVQHPYAQPYPQPAHHAHAQDPRGPPMHSPQQGGRSPQADNEETSAHSADEAQAAPGGGLTLPPIRAAGEKSTWRNGASATSGDSHAEAPPNGQQQKDAEGGAGEDVDKRVHGEDARQLRELGKMVTL